MTPHTPTPPEPDIEEPWHWRTLTVPMPAAITHLLAPLRQIAAANLTAWGLDQTMADDVILALNELATNALRHTTGPVRIQLNGDGTGASLRVEDTSRILPPRAQADHALERTSGYGLEIVDSLATETLLQILGAHGKIITAKFNR